MVESVTPTKGEIMKTLLHTGNNLNTAQKYENAIWALHPEHGELKTASQMKRENVSREYAEWSEANEPHSKVEGMAAYARIHAKYFPASAG